MATADPLIYLNPLEAIATGARIGTAIQAQRLDERRQRENIDLARQAEGRLERTAGASIATDAVQRRAQEVALELNQFQLEKTKANALNELDDAVQWNKYSNDLSPYLESLDPMVPPPKIPAFKTQRFQDHAAKVQDHLIDLSARKQLMDEGVRTTRINQQFRLDRVKRANEVQEKTGATDLVITAEDGLPDVNPVRFAEETKKMADMGMKSPEEQRADVIVSGLISERRIPPKDAATAKTQIMGAGGRLPTLASRADQDIRSSAIGVDVGDQLTGLIDKFENDFGKGSVDSYFGIIDAPVEDFLRRAKKLTSPRDKAAADIVQKYFDLKNQKLRTVSGQAVTASESERMERQIGSVVNANFVRQIRNFTNQEKRSLALTIAGNPLASISGEVEEIARRGLGKRSVRTKDGKVIEAEKFHTPLQAYRAGKNAGDYILLFDPAINDFRGFIME